MKKISGNIAWELRMENRFRCHFELRREISMLYIVYKRIISWGYLDPAGAGLGMTLTIHNSYSVTISHFHPY